MAALAAAGERQDVGIGRFVVVYQTQLTGLHVAGIFMFLLRRPSPQDVDRFIAESSKLPLSYTPIGLAKEHHTGFDVDEHVAVVGRGEAAFERARRALAEWRHFDLGWVELFPADAPVALGSNTGEVTYSIRAVSRPRARLAQVGYPVTRFLQTRFRRESGQAIAKAIAA